MAGFLRGLGAAFSGAATGAAKAAVLEDERRVDVSKTVYADMVTQSDTFLERKQKILDEIDKEKQLVDSLALMEVNGKPLTLVERQGLVRFALANNYEKPAEVLKDFEMNTEEGARIINTKGATKKIATRTPQEDDSTLLFGSRTKAATEDALKLLKATGRDIDVTMPSRTSVEGVRFTRKPDTDVDFENAYIVGSDGIPTRQVLSKRTYNKETNKVDVEYFDKSTGRAVEVDRDERVSSSADAFSKEKPFSDFGPLMVFGKDGLPELLKDETGKIVSGYLMKNGEIRLQVAGKISDDVYNPQGQTVLIAGKDYAPSLASGDLSAFGKMFKFPPVKDFYTQLPELDIAAGANDILFSRSEKRLELHARYGDSMYGIEGGFADLVTATNKVVKGTASIVLGLSGMRGATLEEKIAYLDSSGQISELRNVADNQDELMKGVIGTAEEIAMARTIDSAIATVTAYDLAKQTGDTRISNQDFDAYISTVTGNTAAQTIKLIRNGLDDSLTIYTSKHGAVTRARNRIPDIEGTEQYQKSFDDALKTVVHPSVYRQKFNDMFAEIDKPQAITIVSEDINTEVVTVDGQKQLKVTVKGVDAPIFLRGDPEDYSDEEIEQAVKNILGATQGDKE